MLLLLGGCFCVEVKIWLLSEDFDVVGADGLDILDEETRAIEEPATTACILEESFFVMLDGLWFVKVENTLRCVEEGLDVAVIGREELADVTLLLDRACKSVAVEVTFSVLDGDDCVVILA
jgi:hypothetical protein